MWWIIGAVATVVTAIVVIIWAATATPSTPMASTTPFDHMRCHNEQPGVLVCNGPCAPIGGSTCVTAEIDPNHTTRTSCINGPFRFPFIRVVPGGQVQTGWGVCLL